MFRSPSASLPARSPASKSEFVRPRRSARRRQAGPGLDHVAPRALRLESLESRRVLTTFVDSFESPTLDSFWSLDQYSGAATYPATTQAHSGVQSIQFSTTPGSIEKQVGIWHKFDEPIYGTVSAWFYDSGAAVSSSNYIALWLHNNTDAPGWNITMTAYDYNFADGAYYHVQAAGAEPSSYTHVPRTTGWHQFEVSALPGDITYRVDGAVVYHGSEDLRFDQIELTTYAPFWRPSFTTYFDDFRFESYDPVEPRPDLIAQSVSVDGGVVDFSWAVAGQDLDAAPALQLVWSDDAVYDPGVDVLAQEIDTTGQQSIGVYAGSVELASLGIPKAHLLLVVDPDQLVAESDEVGAELGANNVVGADLQLVGIDVKPGSATNPVNLAAQGVIPVALFTTADFNAAWVDVASVRFAGAVAVHAALEDLDADGDLDLILQFRLEDTDLLDRYAELLRDDLADGVLDQAHQAIDVVLSGRASRDGGVTYEDFYGVDTLDTFLSGKKLREFLAHL